MTYIQKERRRRVLTDEDVHKIVDCLEKQMGEHFYNNLGKGIWYFVWRAIIAGVLGLIAWGQFK